MIGDGSLHEAELAHNVHHPQDTFTRDMCNLPFLRLASFSSRFSFLFSLETTREGNPTQDMQFLEGQIAKEAKHLGSNELTRSCAWPIKS